MATAGDDGSIAVWEVSTGLMVSRFNVHDGHANEVLFSDSESLVTCGEETAIKMWNWRDGRLLASLEGHTRTVTSLSLNQDARQLYSGSSDRTRMLWDLVDRKRIREFATHGSRVLRVKQTLRNIGYYGMVDGATGFESLDTSSNHGLMPKEVSAGIESITVSPDGQSMAYGEREGVIRMLRLDKNGQPVQSSIQAWHAHHGRVCDLTFSSDSKSLISVGMDGACRVWPMDVGAGNLVYKHSSKEDGDKPWILESMLLSKDLLVYSSEREIRGWKLPLDEHFQMAIVDATISRLAVSQESNTVYTGDHSGNLRAWSFASDKLKSEWEFAWPLRPAVVESLVSSDASNEVAIASGGEKTAIYIIDSRSGIELRQLVPPDYTEGEFVSNMAYSPSADRLAIAINNRVLIWNRRDGQYVQLKGHTDTVNNLCFDPKEGLLYTISSDRTCRIWDIEKGTCAAVLTHPEGGLLSVLVSPDVRTIVTSGGSGSTYFWHAQVRRLLFVVKGDPVNTRLSRLWSDDWLIRVMNDRDIIAESIPSLE